MICHQRSSQGRRPGREDRARQEGAPARQLADCGCQPHSGHARERGARASPETSRTVIAREHVMVAPDPEAWQVSRLSCWLAERGLGAANRPEAFHRQWSNWRPRSASKFALRGQRGTPDGDEVRRHRAQVTYAYPGLVRTVVVRVNTGRLLPALR